MVRKLLTRATLVAVMGASTSVHAGLLDSVDKTLSEPAKTVNKALGGNAGEVLNVADALPNRYIVVLKEGVAVNQTLDALMSRYGGQADLSFNSVLNGFAAYLNPLQVKALSLDNAVKYVEQDAIQRISEQSQKNATWGLDRIDQKDLPLNKTFSYSAAGKGVHAYIVDTGIRSDHKDFSGRLGNGENTSDDPKQPPAGLLDPIFAILFGEKENPDDPTNDCNGHGTHVAGTVGGSEWGVAKGVTLHAVRVLNCQGAGSNSTVIGGLDWIAKNVQQPAVVNMSLGGGASRAIDEAVEKLIKKGITVVVAAGNDNKDACDYSPARSKPAITVAASDKTDRRADFSNHGRCADLFAPGKDITSAWIDSNRATKTISGTSMASPHVAGVVALLLEKNPKLSPADIEKQLLTLTASGKIRDNKGVPNKLLQISNNK
ncbi:S8 family peptidase [Litorivivens sp.]|uniref:S8 family peptidase n=1 Tax=Litorivivens sp. TaxID=2020868 RepID=UPI003566C0C9